MKNRKTGSLTHINDFKSRKALLALASDYEASLPLPSRTYPNVIFLFDESLAVSGRELLFRRLNYLAEKNEQMLVVTDVGHGRAGFYVNFDEIGAGSQSSGDDYDGCIDAWMMANER